MIFLFYLHQFSEKVFIYRKLARHIKINRATSEIKINMFFFCTHQKKTVPLNLIEYLILFLFTSPFSKSHFQHKTFLVSLKKHTPSSFF